MLRPITGRGSPLEELRLMNEINQQRFGKNLCRMFIRVPTGPRGRIGTIATLRIPTTGRMCPRCQGSGRRGKTVQRRRHKPGQAGQRTLTCQLRHGSMYQKQILPLPRIHGRVIRRNVSPTTTCRRRHVGRIDRNHLLRPAKLRSSVLLHSQVVIRSVWKFLVEQ